MVHILLVAEILSLTACAGLRSLPRPATACDARADIARLWTCVGVPASEHRESGFTSTARVASGDLTRRLRDSSPTRACNERPWSGFDVVDADVPQAAPLRSFAATGVRGKPVIFVIHGLFDSKSDRYVRVAAEALARDGFGVVAPDMRWHGCLFAPSMLAMLGADERTDLVAWTEYLSRQPRFSGRQFGLLGFSLGALTVIQTMGAPDAVRLFRAGAIAVSPGAPLRDVAARLDRRPNPFVVHSAAPFIAYFRWMERFRNRRLGLPLFSSTPFADYLELAAKKREPYQSVDELVASVEPAAAIRGVRRPLLIIASENDPIMTAGSVQAFRSAAAGKANVHVIATRDGGHSGHEGRYPQWFADALNAFFNNSAQVVDFPND